MSYKRILTIQDISCVGQCSLTVALPIISAFGIECSVLPSAVLSTHTTGFSDYTFHNLCDDIPKIKNHWNKESIKFNAIYTGYLGSVKHIKYVKEIFNECLLKDNIKIVDPAFADDGKLYPDFDEEYIKAMIDLCASADYILPNLSEACFLTSTEYNPNYDKTYIIDLLKKLSLLGAKRIILTGISFNRDTTGVVIYSNQNFNYYEHKAVNNKFHGTGDVYASTFVGAKVIGKSDFEAVKIAADYTVDCIDATLNDDNHWYGVKFEPVLHKLINLIQNQI